MSNLFIDGWAAWVQNLGVGTATITPATSTINGAATLVLPTNMGAFIWSDGTNYHAYFVPVTKPLLAGNNLSDVVAATARTNLGLGTAAVLASTAVAQTANNLSDLASASAAQVNLGLVPLFRSYLAGLILSTAGSSSTFGISAGVAADQTGGGLMALGSAYTKTTGAWAVGTGNGSLDSGTIAANTWYTVFLIKRPDTGVVDILISIFSTPGALPTNYTLYRRIGSMKTNGSAQWIRFFQDGDQFMLETPVTDVSATNPGTSAVTRALSVPPGVRVEALCSAGVVCGGSDQFVSFFVTDLQTADTVPSNSGPFTFLGFTNGVAPQLGGQVRVMTNTATQVRSRLQSSASITTFYLNTHGWVDRRGRDS